MNSISSPPAHRPGREGGTRKKKEKEGKDFRYFGGGKEPGNWGNEKGEHFFPGEGARGSVVALCLLLLLLLIGERRLRRKRTK